MTDRLARIVHHLVRQGECEWVEFKVDNFDPSEIGSYISALANTAALVGERRAYMVWGVEDQTRRLVGTRFDHRRERRGNEEIENWLLRKLAPHVNFRFEHGFVDGVAIVLLSIPAASHSIVRFDGEAYIRVGSYKKPLADFGEKERQLWDRIGSLAFERALARDGLEAEEVLGLLNTETYYNLVKEREPTTADEVLSRLIDERFVVSEPGGYGITNLGAILLAKKLEDFDLERKATRLIKYRARDRVIAENEIGGKLGYAIGFQGLMRTIRGMLPTQEAIVDGVRDSIDVYPEIAIRELVANALIHQDFTLTGTGPMVEIFSDRIEITNPGIPLVETDRLIDKPPRSRNEWLGAMMRRFGMCEERGSGLDRVVRAVEAFRLPAPRWRITDNHTSVTLYGPVAFRDMHHEDRLRATYQHAVIQQLSNDYLTNASLRQRFALGTDASSTISRLISDAAEAGQIKRSDPESGSRRHARYVPYWA